MQCYNKYGYSSTLSAHCYDDCQSKHGKCISSNSNELIDIPDNTNVHKITDIYDEDIEYIIFIEDDEETYNLNEEFVDDSNFLDLKDEMSNEITNIEFNGDDIGKIDVNYTKSNAKEKEEKNFLLFLLKKK